MENSRVTNENGVNLTNQINKGLIEFYKCRIQAYYIAQEKRTYCYKVFKNGKVLGFAIAK